MILLLSLLGCSGGVPIPDSVVQDIARDVTKIGHPHGSFVSAGVVGAAWSAGSHDGYLDVASVYTVNQGEKHTLTVRFDIASIDPCKVSTRVISDDGPTPILLDNPIAPGVVGKRVCAALTEEK